jgi:hypothetical protein
VQDCVAALACESPHLKSDRERTEFEASRSDAPGFPIRPS